MAIKKVEVKGKFKYEVIVKIRNKAGKQVMRRRRWFNNERDAKKAEFELLTELQAYKNKTPWLSWAKHFLEKYRLEYRTSTYEN